MFGVMFAIDGASDALVDIARDFSPRLECCGPREIVVDLHGLERLIGDARTIATELRHTAAERGLFVRVAIAGTRTAARLLAHAHPGLTVIEPGGEAEALAPLPIDLLPIVATDFVSDHEATETPRHRGFNGTHLPRSLSASVANATDDSNQLILTFKRWGVRTLGALAALPNDEIAARLGQTGTAWQRLARGEDPRPLVPALPEERFEQALDLEWPIDGLEPLSFVLGRLLEPLSAHLERRDRGAAVLHVRLHLVTREVHARSLELPAPIRDARTLRTLALLDLESNPPPAAIDRVVVAVDPTPGRVLQFSLLTRPLPSPEQLSTLMARLHALMGEGRCGSPVEVDAWQPGAFAMKGFAPLEIPNPTPQIPTAPTPNSQSELSVAIRRFRFPVPARVRVEAGKPSRVTTDRRGLSGGRVEACAGPWRTSGAWWEAHRWDRNEWDVTLHDGATYRLFHERDTDHWFLEGIVD